MREWQRRTCMRWTLDSGFSFLCERDTSPVCLPVCRIDSPVSLVFSVTYLPYLISCFRLNVS
ncbi:hypothetical protein E2C01_072722 [Portunus trituberculatus]|uniref:Uncharacterized protein n=1 Tax=Portunus trituberculatus TaxID=210409 RepID=A0A5B7IBF7_PORTR|nr:hypothetical protein [Portunus trituberculatus]